MSTRNSKKFGDRVAYATFLLVVIQLLVGIFQLILSFSYPDNTLMRQILGVFMVMCVGVVAVLLVRGLK